MMCWTQISASTLCFVSLETFPSRRFLLITKGASPNAGAIKKGLLFPDKTITSRHFIELKTPAALISSREKQQE